MLYDVDISTGRPDLCRLFTIPSPANYIRAGLQVCRDDHFVNDLTVCPIPGALALHLTGSCGTVCLIHVQPVVIAGWFEVDAVRATATAATDPIGQVTSCPKVNAGDWIPCPGTAWGIGTAIHPRAIDREPCAIVPPQLLLAAVEFEWSLGEALLSQSLARFADSVLVPSAVIKPNPPGNFDLCAPPPSLDR